MGCEFLRLRKSTVCAGGVTSCSLVEGYQLFVEQLLLSSGLNCLQCFRNHKMEAVDFPKTLIHL